MNPDLIHDYDMTNFFSKAVKTLETLQTCTIIATLVLTAQRHTFRKVVDGTYGINILTLVMAVSRAHHGPVSSVFVSSFASQEHPCHPMWLFWYPLRSIPKLERLYLDILGVSLTMKV